MAGQLNEKTFELEVCRLLFLYDKMLDKCANNFIQILLSLYLKIMSADNRILQEQLQLKVNYETNVNKMLPDWVIYKYISNENDYTFL